MFSFLKNRKWQDDPNRERLVATRLLVDTADEMGLSIAILTSAGNNGRKANLFRTDKETMMTDAIFNETLLDKILTLQLMVAWAGEGISEPQRLDWWRTDLVDEEGGGDLFKRLFPRTHLWASFEAVRKAAIHMDTRARRSMAKPDQIRTLFFWGFDIDEKLDERLSYHKNRSIPPVKALPFSIDIYGSFNKQGFEAAIRIPGQAVKYKIVPGGREITDPLPESLEQKARYLAAALLPLSDDYPAPFFRGNP